MTLLPNAGSDKAWVWTVQADFADEQPKVEQLAIKFKNAESKSHHVVSAFDQPDCEIQYTTVFSQLLGANHSTVAEYMPCISWFLCTCCYR